MTLLQRLVTIMICSLGTMATRFAPFLIFSEKRKTPKYVEYLGEALPPAMFAFLVVYCLKNVSITTGSHGIPEAIGVALTAITHLWKRNTLLSILIGTVCYMLLVQFVF